MEQVLNFLRSLSCNNNREWFLEHKQEYLQARQTFDAFALELLAEIRKFDNSIGDLALGNMTYRIYRDVRFSKNKDPYKTHMGVYIAPGGKKSGYSGYYFHISTDTSGGWESGHMIAAGDYMCEPRALAILREDIDAGNGDFQQILDELHPMLKLEMGNSLKKVPAGFPADSPYADYLKLKNYCLSCSTTDEFVLAPDLAKRLADIFRTAKPFLDYVNRAIHYSRTEE